MRGCRDILGSSLQKRYAMISRFGEICSTYIYHPIETPILEHAEVFARNLGTNSDILSSEMYHIAETNPLLVLRPEGTAGVARALSKSRQLSMRSHGARVWYTGQMFRRERPQAGRYRQFTQLGVECISDESVTSDAEVIEIASTFLTENEVQTKLRINTLGSQDERKRFDKVLRDYLKPRYSGLSNISRIRFDKGSCMRILDSKLSEDEDALRGAPRLSEFVGEKERRRFEELKRLLEESGIEFYVDETLVRGLEYYTSTAFEFDGKLGKAVCAGGRYEDVEGICGVGFALGVERLELEMGIEADEFLTVFEKELEGGIVVIGLCDSNEESKNKIGKSVREMVRELRRKGYAVATRLNQGKLGKIIGKVVKSGVKVVIVIGEEDLNEDRAMVKIISDKGMTSVPESVNLKSVTEFVSKTMNVKHQAKEGERVYL